VLFEGSERAVRAQVDAASALVGGAVADHAVWDEARERQGRALGRVRFAPADLANVLTTLDEAVVRPAAGIALRPAPRRRRALGGRAQPPPRAHDPARPGGRARVIPELTRACVHCGFCCRRARRTSSGARRWTRRAARIQLMEKTAQGTLALSPTVVEHFDRCLGCMACVTSCPSGVRYDR
jgi:NAD-dependent dihydropyrimidine dehydrogenase PreA subunit